MVNQGKLVVEVVQIAMLSGGALLLISVFYGVFKLRRIKSGRDCTDSHVVCWCSPLLISVFYGVFKLRENQGKLVVEVVQANHVIWWCSPPTDISILPKNQGKLVVEVVQIAMLSGGALVLLISVFYGLFKLRENQKIESKGKLVVELCRCKHPCYLDGTPLTLQYLYSMVYLDEGESKARGESKGKLVVEVVQIAMLSGGALLLPQYQYSVVLSNMGESKGESVSGRSCTSHVVCWCSPPVSVFYGVFKLRESKIESKGKLVVEVVQIAMLSGSALVPTDISILWCVFKLRRIKRENQKVLVVEASSKVSCLVLLISVGVFKEENTCGICQIELSGGALILLISVFYGIYKLRENQKENQLILEVEAPPDNMLSGGALILTPISILWFLFKLRRISRRAPPDNMVVQLLPLTTFDSPIV
ncbi:unnamed protein product [Mytilus edulis]|uniref:Uncharacterized protein n=1 Tax=Mytilus edulis TaxID=6550 RepID=A0A8S3S2S2_MYTED|nr:unnamed protein product [Mytilus edulis]